MNKIFIVWQNYEGHCVEEFDSQPLAEERIVEILKQKATDSYGTEIVDIIKGKRLVYDTVQYASVVKLKQHE